MKKLSLFILGATLIATFQNCSNGLNSSGYTSSAGNSIIPGGNNTGGTGTTPNPPSLLAATAASSSQINLTWNDNSNDETGFRVERAFAVAGPFTSGMGPFTTLANLGPNIRSYSDINLQPSTLYYYRVIAVNGAKASGPSNQVSATTQVQPTSPPSPPTGLSAAASAATVVQLQWTDASNNESYFQVERSTNNGATFTFIAATSANVTNFQDYNLNASSNYQYRVRAVNTAGNSNFSNVANGTTPAAGNTATYTYISANIIGPNCVDCHGPALAAAGYNFSTYNSLNGSRTQAINAIKGGRMPPGAPLSAQQISILDAWIAAGAPNN